MIKYYYIFIKLLLMDYFLSRKLHRGSFLSELLFINVKKNEGQLYFRLPFLISYYSSLVNFFTIVLTMNKNKGTTVEIYDPPYIESVTCIMMTMYVVIMAKHLRINKYII